MRVKRTILPNEVVLRKLERAEYQNRGELRFVFSAMCVTVKEGLRKHPLVTTPDVQAYRPRGADGVDLEAHVGKRATYMRFFSPRIYPEVSCADMSRSPPALGSMLQSSEASSSATGSEFRTTDLKMSSKRSLRFSALLTYLAMYRTACSQSKVSWKSIFGRQ